MTNPGNSLQSEKSTVAESMLQTLAESGIEYVFSNFGTDHTPIIEAAARLREAGLDNTFPTFIPCPHEFVALSAAHGYAQASGDPQAVLVHVDVGTQNLGAAMHNAHRANAPVLIMAGLAPVSNEGYPGSRDNPIHFYQDVFDQTSIVSEYCRWTDEYRTPADPTESIQRGIERACASPTGPTYLSFAREALEEPIPTATTEPRPIRKTKPTAPDDDSVNDIADAIDAADRPLVVTSQYPGSFGDPGIESLVSFAEKAGAGVVEHYPSILCFPRDHEQHVGFDPTDVVEKADLLLLLQTDVPWMPADVDIADETPVIQIDTDPTKSEFPSWPFNVDETLMADPAAAVRRITEQISSTAETDVWRDIHESNRQTSAERLEKHRAEERLTADVLSDEIATHVDEDTILIQGALTNRAKALSQIVLSEPGSYYWRGGAGLGWGVPAGIGVKLAEPESRVISLIGDGGYLFSNPAASALTAKNADAPTLTVVYNNGSWESVRSATRGQHETGAAVKQGIPEGNYGDATDLSQLAAVSDAHVQQVEEFESLQDAIADAIEAVDTGTDAVLDVRVEK